MELDEPHVVVGVSPSLAGLAALRFGVAEARRRQGHVYAVRAWYLHPTYRGSESRRWRAQLADEAARVVYSTQLDLPSNGEWRIAAILREDGELKGTSSLTSAVVGEFHRVPRPGERAPTIHTPTAQDVGGDLSKITTRTPPDTQNKVDYAEALGKEPIVLVFATPKFCQSRVCGPVVDVAEQVKNEYGDEAAFIHMEIYNGNDPGLGVRGQVLAFHLPTEPYLFAIDRHGVVRDAIEGAFGLKLMHEAVDKAIAP